MAEDLKPCPCKKLKCERHGNCDACREHHLTKKRYPPYCDRQAKRAEEKAQKRKRKD
jgi:hypothetical protein